MQRTMVALCLLPQSHAPSREAGSFLGPIVAIKQGCHSFTGILAAGSRRSCLAVRTLLHMPHPLTVMRGLIFATFVTIPASTMGSTTQSIGL